MPFGALLNTYSEVLASSKPLPHAVGGLFGTGIRAGANIERAVVVSRVAAKEGVGQGRLSRSRCSNYDDPWAGNVGDKRPLALGQRHDSQEENYCLHGEETNTTA